MWIIWLIIFLYSYFRNVLDTLMKCYISVFLIWHSCRSTNTQEDDEDVDDSKERRESKSRYVLRRLRNGEIPYRSGYNRLYGNIACPFCCASIKSDYDSLIMHGTYIGRGNGRNRKPHVRAKHAAFGAFLRKNANGASAILPPEASSSDQDAEDLMRCLVVTAGPP